MNLKNKLIIAGSILLPSSVLLLTFSILYAPSLFLLFLFIEKKTTNILIKTNIGITTSITNQTLTTTKSALTITPNASTTTSTTTGMNSESPSREKKTRAKTRLYAS